MGCVQLDRVDPKDSWGEGSALTPELEGDNQGSKVVFAIEELNEADRGESGKNEESRLFLDYIRANQNLINLVPRC